MALMSVPYLTMTSSRSKTARLSDLSKACITQCVLSPPLACKYTATVVAATRGIRASIACLHIHLAYGTLYIFCKRLHLARGYLPAKMLHCRRAPQDSH
jgi:hypothetical protein